MHFAERIQAPNHAAVNPAIAIRLQSWRPAGRVAEHFASGGNSIRGPYSDIDFASPIERGNVE
jgi:hypothetical protein